MNNIIKRKWNQNSMVIIEDLQGVAFQAESGGHTFQISGIDGEGNPVALSGTPAGVMLRSDGQDVTLTCSVSGGVVFATLPANAYVVPGRFGLTIFLTSDGQKTAIYAAVGTVGKTSSGTVAPPAGSDVVDLVNAIAAAVATIPASYTDLMASVAPTYSSSGLYAVGSYAWYNGKLYRCTTAITSGETWTSGHWTLANLGSDLVDLKSAFANFDALELTPSSISNGYNIYPQNSGFYQVANGSVAWFDIENGASYAISRKTVYILTNSKTIQNNKEVCVTGESFVNTSGYKYLCVNYKDSSGVLWGNNISRSKRATVKIGGDIVNEVSFDSNPQTQIDDINSAFDARPDKVYENLLYDLAVEESDYDVSTATTEYRLSEANAGADLLAGHTYFVYYEIEIGSNVGTWLSSTVFIPMLRNNSNSTSIQIVYTPHNLESYQVGDKFAIYGYYTPNANLTKIGAWMVTSNGGTATRRADWEYKKVYLIDVTGLSDYSQIISAFEQITGNQRFIYDGTILTISDELNAEIAKTDPWFSKPYTNLIYGKQKASYNSDTSSAISEYALSSESNGTALIKDHTYIAYYEIEIGENIGTWPSETTFIAYMRNLSTNSNVTLTNQHNANFGSLTAGDKIKIYGFYTPSSDLSNVGAWMVLTNGGTSTRRANWIYNKVYIIDVTGQTNYDDVLNALESADGNQEIIGKSKLQKISDEVDEIAQDYQYNADLICWGDSLTMGAGGDGTTYPKVCADTLGLTVLNCGVGGENCQTIAARQGGNNIVIPIGNINGTYETLTDIFGNTVAPLLQGSGAGSGNALIIDGETCSLSYSSGTGYTISGYTGGAKTVPTLARFAGSDFKGKIIVIWAGSNGGAFPGQSTLLEIMTAWIKSMIAHIGHEKYVVIGLTNGEESASFYANIENSMKQTFGNKYLPIRKYMIESGLTIAEEAGLVRTEEEVADDNTDISEGKVPRSLKSDAVHMNKYGYTAIGKILANKIQSLGYV